LNILTTRAAANRVGGATEKKRGSSGGATIRRFHTSFSSFRAVLGGLHVRAEIRGATDLAVR
jgi:hypothetical protein